MQNNWIMFYVGVGFCVAWVLAGITFVTLIRRHQESLSQGRLPLSRVSKVSRLLRLIRNYRKKPLDEIQKLKEQLKCLSQRSQELEKKLAESAEALTKFRLENTLLGKFVKDLESHKEALIQELSSGLPSETELEFMSWQWILQKIRLTSQELDQATTEKKTLVQQNEYLHHTHNLLAQEVRTINDKNTELREKYQTIQKQSDFWRGNCGQAKNDIISFARRNKELQAKLEHLEKATRNDLKVTELEREILDLKSQLTQAEARNQLLIDENQGLVQLRAELTGELSKARIEIAARVKKIAELVRSTNFSPDQSRLIATLKNENKKLGRSLARLRRDWERAYNQLS